MLLISPCRLAIQAADPSASHRRTVAKTYRFVAGSEWASRFSALDLRRSQVELGGYSSGAAQAPARDRPPPRPLPLVDLLGTESP
jgi:hypothetical protein